MRTVSRAATGALALAASLAACGGGGSPAATTTTAPAPPPASSAPAPSTSPTTQATGRACDLVTTAEAAVALGVTVVTTGAGDDTHCAYHPEPRTDTTAYFAVTLHVSTDEFEDRQVDSRTGEGYREIPGLGDRAFFYASAVYVLAGDTSFEVLATSDTDRDKQWSQIRTATQAEYVRIGTEVATLVEARV